MEVDMRRFITIILFCSICILSFSSFLFAKEGNTSPGTSIPQQIQGLQDQVDTIELTPGPQGEQGETGPQGPQGEPGTSGTITSLDQLNGADCTIPGGEDGFLEVQITLDGGVTLKCVVPPPDPGGGGDPPGPIVQTQCDENLAINDADPLSAAKALELCETTTTGTGFGVIGAKFVRSNGDLTPHSVQMGILPDFGPNNTPHSGQKMLVLSSGHARDAGDPNACGNAGCQGVGQGTPPSGFPVNPSVGPNGFCPSGNGANDDVGLEVTLRAPAGAIGFSVDYNVFFMDFPTYVCTDFNDHFLILMSPGPGIPADGNIAFDALNNPVTLNSAIFESCSPFGPYACPGGRSALQGTGFDIWAGANGGASTGWLTTSAPVTGGQEFTLRFTVFDVSDQIGDSTALIDNFRWITAP